MTQLLVIIGGLLAATGVWLIVTGVSPAAAPLGRTIAFLHRESSLERNDAGRWGRIGRLVLRLVGDRGAVELGDRQALRLVGRPVELHAAYLATGAFVGFFAPLLLGVVMTFAGLNPTPWLISIVVAIGGAVLGVFAVHIDLRQRAETISTDLRHQLSAYLNVLTMLLAANHGNEGALKLAAAAGDGQLFVELRRRITESATAGRPTVTALAALGRDLGLIELIEIAASASLATSQGAPVSRSLVAKTETLRSTLQAEAEQEARMRTSRITMPLVAMGLVFIAIGLYPALSSIHQGT